MQKDPLVNGSTDVESSSSSSGRQESWALAPWSESHTSNAAPSDQTMIREPLPADSIPSPSTSPRQLPASQPSKLTRATALGSPNLSASSTWENPDGRQVCFSPLAHNPDATTSGSRSLLRRIFDRPWVQPTIGLTTLLITLIALFVYSHRAFVMAAWTEKNDMLQACAQLAQGRSNITYPQCDNTLAKGPQPPPYVQGNTYTPAARVYDLRGRTRRMPRSMQRLRSTPGNADVLNGTQTNEVGRFYTDSNTAARASHVYVTAICGICVLAAASTGFMLAQRLRRPTTLSYTVRKGGHFRAIIWTLRGGPQAKDAEKSFRSARRQQQQEVEPIRVLKQIRRRVRPKRSMDW